MEKMAANANVKMEQVFKLPGRSSRKCLRLTGAQGFWPRETPLTPCRDLRDGRTQKLGVPGNAGWRQNREARERARGTCSLATASGAIGITGGNGAGVSDVTITVGITVTITVAVTLVALRPVVIAGDITSSVTVIHITRGAMEILKRWALFYFLGVTRAGWDTAFRGILSDRVLKDGQTTQIVHYGQEH
jgi:hypothetical protein